MKALLSATIPTDVGEVLLVGCALIMAGLLGWVIGTGTERRTLRRLLDESFNDPELAKLIFVTQWAVSAPPGGEDTDPDALWDDHEYLREESTAAARAVRDRVTTDLDL